MSGNLIDPFCVVIILAVDRILFLCSYRAQRGRSIDIITQGGADFRIVGDDLRYDIRGTLQSFFNRCNTLLLIHIGSCSSFRIRAVGSLGKQESGKRLQPLLLCHGCTGAALLLIWPVQIFQGCKGFRLINGSGQFLRHFTLLSNGAYNCFPAFIQRTQILQPFIQRAKGGVIHGAVKLLTVAGNKGNGVALVNQLNNIVDVGRVEIQFFCNLQVNVHLVLLCGW